MGLSLLAQGHDRTLWLVSYKLVSNFSSSPVAILKIKYKVSLPAGTPGAVLVQHLAQFDDKFAFMIKISCVQAFVSSMAKALHYIKHSTRT
ncbi:MAG: hypothetical protein CVV11_16830 [Gammaproteobacteria bacterium HGW-Gammaproteobacteria-15]|nr:MAG: hypothetical protein CVV11_16830 [Gammaproteobacteria bacterium HGW-Gammaproteobacteria-15]